MKRAIVIVVLLGTLVLAAVDDKFTDLVTDAEQRQKVIHARAIIQKVWLESASAHAELQEIAASGSFNTVDSELKAVLLDAWQVIKDANTGFADPNIAKLLKWTKPK